MQNQPFDILLVDDSPSDQLLAKQALAGGSLVCRVHVVTDGVEALAFLRNQGQYELAARPDLILLDLNLPRKDGREVLVELKADESLKRIPVVVLTTSVSERDLDFAYGLHANCYVEKPVDFDDFTRAVQAIKDFWFRTVRLPKPEAETLPR